MATPRNPLYGSLLWSFDDQVFLATHYPSKGKEWCAEALKRPVASIRSKASRMGLALDRDSEFFKEFQERAARSKVGKKRPAQAVVMRQLHENGKLKRSEESCRASVQRMAKARELNGHPRGALGLRHSAETKAVIGKKSAEAFAAMSDDQKAARNRKIVESRHENGHYADPAPNKSWKSGWREIGGFKKYYRSRWEANYARYLEWLRCLGQIKSWEHEPHVFWFDGVKRGCVSYLPDFRVTENSGAIVYHEVKGWMDERSATKLKRMAKYHPDVKLVLIEGPDYKRLAKQVSSFCEGWESEERVCS